jgi:4-phytase / acid phosphatase
LSKSSKRKALATLCLLAGQTSTAQSRSAPVAGSVVKNQLRMVVILSRHGVRSPTWAQERLDRYSALPWPKWGVPPADLTQRGYQLIQQFASFDRTSLVEAGLLAAHGCDDASKTYIWADTDQRTVVSGKALAEGLFPGCALQVHSLADGESDPLFHSTAKGVAPVQADAAFAEFSERAKTDPGHGELLNELNNVLRGCVPTVACSPKHAPETALLGGPTAPVRGKGDRIVDLLGPVPLGSTFSEDLLLEYGDGMPMDQVGWGHVDEAQLRRFLALHSDYFELMHRTPALARLEASNLLFHIARTLDQGVAEKPIADAIGPPGTKLVLLAGHDTNLAGVAALLGLHWTLDGRNDDTPPGAELAFELWQDEHGAYSVRVTAAMQTLHQLREMPELNAAHPPAHAILTLPGCAAQRQGCRWEDFQRTVNGAIDKNDLFPVGPN